jgi:opacity protein-like surface antigen
MFAKKLLIAASVLAPLLAGILYAQSMQAPVVNIDPHRHGNLASAQEYIVAAFQKIDAAQSANGDQLGGHAQNAKDFLAQADAELRAAADFANARNPQPPPDEPPAPANASGNWTIYAANIDRPGGSTKTVRITQTGAQLGGHFKGPNQSGGIEGFVNGNHIEFSTKTRDVLTFRGTVEGDTMSGLFGLHGQHAPWHAVRSD